MPRKQGRPALSPEEREERREARNQKAREDRARDRGRRTDDDEEYEPRGRQRPGWVSLVSGALLAFAIVLLMGALRRKREEEGEEEGSHGVGAATIMVKRLDGKEESLQYWTVGITQHMGNTFKAMNAEHAELAQRVNATERRLTELEKE